MAVQERSESVMAGLQRLFGLGTVAGLSEGQLLARFVGERDQVAFEAIVSRHGPMVLGICRRLLDDPHDVEDAFQATFLVLVRRAGSLRDRDLLANWLYGVALKVATRCRRDRSRRRTRERAEPDTDTALPVATDEADLGELRSVLDLEVDRLPSRFRAPVVLCYFEGLTHDQAAERLGCPVGTVRSRMSRAREILRSRLIRRGLGPASLIPTAPLAGLAPEVPLALMAATAASVSGQGRSLAALGSSTSVITLARGVLRAMTLSKWMTIGAALLVLGVAGGGIGVAARQDGGAAATKPTRSQVAKEEPANRSPFRAMEELQSWITRSEAQLAVSQGEIVRQKDEITNLQKRIHELESKVQANAATPKIPPTAATPAAASNTMDNKPRGADIFRMSFDRIVKGPEALVSISGANDKVVIYRSAPDGAGRSRLYRPPPGSSRLEVSFHGPNVTIVANGKGDVHLANYNLKSDQWALQDIRAGREGSVSVTPWNNGPAPGALLPCMLRGKGFTQVAVLDFDRAAWTVQNLIEPTDEYVEPFTVGKMVMYVVARHVYAYSAEAGRWDTLTLDERLLPRPGIGLGGEKPFWMQDDLFAVSQNGRMHIFTAKLGQWQSINPRD